MVKAPSQMMLLSSTACYRLRRLNPKSGAEADNMPETISGGRGCRGGRDCRRDGRRGGLGRCGVYFT